MHLHPLWLCTSGLHACGIQGSTASDQVMSAAAGSRVPVPAAGTERRWGYSSIARLMSAGEIGIADATQVQELSYTLQVHTSPPRPALLKQHPQQQRSQGPQ